MIDFDHRLGFPTREVWAVVGTETDVDDNYPSSSTTFQVYAIAQSEQKARDYLWDLAPYAGDASAMIVETILIES